MNGFERIMEPIRVAGLKIENRILMPAMHMNMAPGGMMTDGLIDFYEERAKARPGPGLMILGGCYAEHRGLGTPSMVGISDDRFIPGLTRFTERMHRHGQAVGAQLYHAGRYVFSMLTGEQGVAPSAVMSRFNKEMPRALSTAEVEGVVENFGAAAGRAREAGFDAVELIGNGGYLLNQFLSPIVNLREDRYGGDINGRMTFMREVLAAMREAVGDDFPIILRLSGSDFVDGSHTLDEARAVAAEAERYGADMISVTGGWHETRVPQITMNVPRGAFVYLAEGIKSAVDQVPVACCNRVNSPELAEQILSLGRADLVGMARGFLADPQILQKAVEGRGDEIATCIGCTQGCFDHVMFLKPISCTVNPRANIERETCVTPAESPRKVLVVGGGPAGMQVAVTAAERGHDTCLWEKSDRLGGQLNLAAVPPGREEWSEVVRYFTARLKATGVDLQLSREADFASISRHAPDVLIIATGAYQAVPAIEGIEGPNVLYAWDLLSGEVEAGVDFAGRRVLVVGGGAVGIETGTMLADLGAVVTVVEALGRIGNDIGPSSRWTILQDAAGAGVETVIGCDITAIREGGAVGRVDGTEEFFKADKVIIATGSKANDRLAKELAERKNGRLEVIAIGDCLDPRKAFDAIHEGFRTGLIL